MHMGAVTAGDPLQSFELRLSMSVLQRKPASPTWGPISSSE